MVTVEFERKDKTKVNSTTIPSTAGIAQEIYFQPRGGGAADVNVELALRAGETQPILKAFRASGFTISALHNHMVWGLPPL